MRRGLTPSDLGDLFEQPLPIGAVGRSKELHLERRDLAFTGAKLLWLADLAQWAGMQQIHKGPRPCSLKDGKERCRSRIDTLALETNPCRNDFVHASEDSPAYPGTAGVGEEPFQNVVCFLKQFGGLWTSTA